MSSVLTRLVRTSVATPLARTARPVMPSASPLAIPAIRSMASATARPAPIVTYDQVKPWSEQPSLDRVIIDVRETHEVAEGSIPSAVNVPLSVLPKALDMNPDTFRNTYGFEKPEGNKEVVFYCRSGKRSTTASELGAEKGLKNIKNYTGSWLDWVEKEQGKK